MSRLVPGLTLTAAAALIAACNRPPAPQQAASAPPAAAPGVVWTLVVLYNQPKDTAAFEKYYAESHLPLVAAHAAEVAPTRFELIKFAPGADGKAPAFYREADLRWDSKEARDRGMGSAGFQAIAADIPKFATGGFTVLLGQKTN